MGVEGYRGTGLEMEAVADAVAGSGNATGMAWHHGSN